MPEVRILYWRDIPAQVVVGAGRRAAAKVELSSRFVQAIDQCALQAVARDAGAYLVEWRPSEAYTREGEPAEIAEGEAERLEGAFPAEAIRTLVANEGWADPRA